MPFLAYEAKDSAGKAVRGSLLAGDGREARSLLEGRGFTHVRVGGAMQTPVAPAPRAPAAPVLVAAPVVVASREERAAYRPFPRAVHFLFVRWAVLARTGVSSSSILDDLANSPPSKTYRTVLADMRDRTAAGGSVADAMAEHPGAFSPDEVGVARAGERAGFLPEAFAMLSEAAIYSKRLRSSGWYGLALLVFFGLGYPFLLAAVQASDLAMARQDVAGGALPPWATFRTAYAERLGGAILTTLPWMVGAAGLVAGWLSPGLRELRHALALRVPVVGARARAESMERFGVLCARLSAAGLPPSEVFAKAAAGVPNLALRRSLMASAGGARENEPMSQALGRALLFDRMELDVVRNGEIAGDVPGALLSLAVARREDFDARDAVSKTVIRFTSFGAAALATLLIVAYLYPVMYQQMIKRALQE